MASLITEPSVEAEKNMLKELPWFHLVSGEAQVYIHQPTLTVTSQKILTNAAEKQMRTAYISSTSAP